MAKKKDADPIAWPPKGLAKPAQRALANAGITSLKQLAAYGEAEVLALHGMGPNAMGALRAALSSAGLTFTQSR
jgi:hypothetical protein